MKPEYRDYFFREWICLTEVERRDLINNYWDPQKPENGKMTRNEIIKNFIEKIGKEIDYCEYRYFGFYASALFVIPTDSKTKLPKEFYGLIVNKGKIETRLHDNLWKVKWRLSGKEELKIK